MALATHANSRNTLGSGSGSRREVSVSSTSVSLQQNNLSTTRPPQAFSAEDAAAITLRQLVGDAPPTEIMTILPQLSEGGKPHGVMQSVSQRYEDDFEMPSPSVSARPRACDPTMASSRSRRRFQDAPVDLLCVVSGRASARNRPHGVSVSQRYEDDFEVPSAAVSGRTSTRNRPHGVSVSQRYEDDFEVPSAAVSGRTSTRNRPHGVSISQRYDDDFETPSAVVSARYSTRSRPQGAASVSQRYDDDFESAATSVNASVISHSYKRGRDPMVDSRSARTNASTLSSRSSSAWSSSSRSSNSPISSDHSRRATGAIIRAPSPPRDVVGSIRIVQMLDEVATMDPPSNAPSPLSQPPIREVRRPSTEVVSETDDKVNDVDNVNVVDSSSDDSTPATSDERRAVPKNPTVKPKTQTAAIRAPSLPLASPRVSRPKNGVEMRGNVLFPLQSRGVVSNWKPPTLPTPRAATHRPHPPGMRETSPTLPSSRSLVSVQTREIQRAAERHAINIARIRSRATTSMSGDQPPDRQMALQQRRYRQMLDVARENRWVRQRIRDVVKRPSQYPPPPPIALPPSNDGAVVDAMREREERWCGDVRHGDIDRLPLTHSSADGGTTANGWRELRQRLAEVAEVPTPSILGEDWDRGPAAVRQPPPKWKPSVYNIKPMRPAHRKGPKTPELSAVEQACALLRSRAKLVTSSGSLQEFINNEAQDRAGLERFEAQDRAQLMVEWFYTSAGGVGVRKWLTLTSTTADSHVPVASTAWWANGGRATAVEM